MKRSTTGLLIASGLILTLGGTAAAGEYNGKGEPIPGAHKASSECAFSGRDVPDDVENNPLPEFDDDEFTDGRVQSYGILVKAGLKPFLPSPGDACRGNIPHD
jgi:hypothetical protein